MAQHYQHIKYVLEVKLQDIETTGVLLNNEVFVSHLTTRTDLPPPYLPRAKVVISVRSNFSCSNTDSFAALWCSLSSWLSSGYTYGTTQM